LLNRLIFPEEDEDGDLEDRCKGGEKLCQTDTEEEWVGAEEEA
jgi:hypothetical protein